MPKTNYRLHENEWKQLKTIADFYVRVHCLKNNLSFQSLLKREYQGIAGELVDLEWRPYLMQVERPKDGLTLLSKQSILAFKNAYKSFTDERNVVARQQPEYKEIADMFYELKIALDEKQSMGRDIYKKEKVKQPSHNQPTITKSDFIASFQNSTWYCYERHIQYIGCRVIKFETADESGLCAVKIYHSNLEKNDLQGAARFIPKDQSIAISLTNDEGSEYTHFLIRIDSRPNKLELCIGHKTFRNRNRDNIVSKAIILTRYERVEKPISKLLEFSDPLVPEQIREFFVNRSLNRLSSPHARSVYNLETLEEWLDQNRHRSTFKYNAILGTYNVRYRIAPDDQQFKQDLLEVVMSKAGELQLTYTHENNKGESYDWKGKGYVNFESRILSAYLKGPITSEVPEEEQSFTDDKPIFLMINVPTRETRKIEVLTGLAAATRDGDQGSVGRLMVMTKAAVDKEFSETDHNEFHAFFDCFKDRAWVRPPISKTVPYIAELKDLIEARIEREKRKQDESRKDG